MDGTVQIQQDERRTLISAGIAVHAILRDSVEVSAIATSVFPLVSGNAALPYVAYFRSGISQSVTKSGFPGAETAEVDIICYDRTYTGAVRLAEAVRGALEGFQGEAGGLKVRYCAMTDAADRYDADAYAVHMIFRISINH